MTKKKTTLIIAILVLAAIFVLSACDTHTCTFGEWKVVKEATCTENGLKERVCTDPDCNEKETEVIPAAHTLTDVSAVSATCDTDGHIAYKLCEVCGKIFDANDNELTDEQIVIAAHHDVTHVTAVAASEHVGGTVAYDHCEVCGKNFDIVSGNELQDVTSAPLHADYDAETLYCTTCDKYVITNAEQLAKFRDSVNGGNNYSGKTVVLDQDVDLNNVEWTPIDGFKGTFDGQNHKIENLKITSGNDKVGLFGNQWQCAATIKNFTVDVAEIVGGENVGTIVGLTASTSIINVTVRNANIASAHWVGGIVGYAYCNVSDCTVENLAITCVPNGAPDNYDNGDKVGGIVGYLASGTAENCSVSNVTLKGYRDIGGVVGILQKDGDDPCVRNCTVNGVDITLDQVTNFYGAKEMNVDGVVGRFDKTTAILEGNQAQEVTYKFIVGPASAQAALDAAKANSTIQLSEGVYDKLYVRQSKYTSQDLGESYPKYKRVLENLTIVGCQGAVVNGMETVAGHIYATDGSVTNPVTGAQQNYYSHIEYQNLVIKDVKFADFVEFNGWESTLQSGKGISIENCEFDMIDSERSGYVKDERNGNIAALHFGASTGMRIWTNVKVEGCTFKNTYQGIYIVNAENLTVQNCTFENLFHNAVAVQTNGTDDRIGTVGGNIVISDNTFANGGDRPFRFGNVGADAAITISGNAMTNYSDDQGEILKTETTAVGATITFSGNTYGGTNLEDSTISCDGNRVILTNAAQNA